MYLEDFDADVEMVVQEAKAAQWNWTLSVRYYLNNLRDDIDKNIEKCNDIFNDFKSRFEELHDCNTFAL